MGTVTPIRNDILPVPISVYQRKGFIACERAEAHGCIEHTRKGEKWHWLRYGDGWRLVSVREYLQAMEVNPMAEQTPDAEIAQLNAQLAEVRNELKNKQGQLDEEEGRSLRFESELSALEVDIPETEREAERRWINANRAIQELLALCEQAALLFSSDDGWVARFQKIQDEWEDS